jgi:hypothetical protein
MEEIVLVLIALSIDLNLVNLFKGMWLLKWHVYFDWFNKLKLHF